MTHPLITLFMKSCCDHIVIIPEGVQSKFTLHINMFSRELLLFLNYDTVFCLLDVINIVWPSEAKNFDSTFWLSMFS